MRTSKKGRKKVEKKEEHQKIRKQKEKG